MTVLFTRLLKAPFLRSFLEQGVDILIPHRTDAYLALYAQTQNGEMLIHATPAAHPPPSGSLRFPLKPHHHEGLVLGHLLAGPITPDEPADSPFRKTAAFLARQLGELINRATVRHSLGTEALDQYRSISLMQRAVINLNSSMKLLGVVKSLVEECKAAEVPADYAIVLRTNGRIEYAESMRQGEGGPGKTLPEHSLLRLTKSERLGRVMHNGKCEVFNDLPNDPEWKDEAPGIHSLLLAPLRGPRFDLGTLVLVGVGTSSTFSSAHLKKVDTLCNVAGIAAANAYHFEQVHQILMALVKAMTTAIDARDRLTAGHSQRVAQYALGVAMVLNKDTEFFPKLEFTEEQHQEFFYAGLLHDVGKIGVREEVLTKETRLPRPHLELLGLRLALWGEMNRQPWKEIYARLELINKAYDITREDTGLIVLLSEESLDVLGNTVQVLTEDEAHRLLTPRGNLTAHEREEIKRHPEESYRILKNIPFTGHFPNILTMVLQHHERLDGSGYPYGIKARDIIIQSRIMAIVDMYDALRQDRHYKKALGRDMALTVLRQEAKRKRLDHKLVELFCRDIDEIEKALSLNIDTFPGMEFPG